MKTVKLTHTFRLPDELQVDALRLLEASRNSVNTIVERLWDRLDEFADSQYQAWKQVTAMLPPLHNHGSRQWRCEAETAGRILRSQAERKRVFDSIKPILADGLINHGKKRKNRKALFEAIENLRATLGGDADSVAFMLNLTEQACNFYLENGSKFPETYEEMQTVPALKTGMLTYAADDGGKMARPTGMKFAKINSTCG